MKIKLSIPLFFLLLNCFQVNSQCRERDSLALVAFYNATDGANWTNTWDLSTPIDTWYGVSLDGNECLNCLELDGNLNNCSPLGPNTGNNLSGTLPPEIGDWIDIEYLLLGKNNGLNGSLPDELYNLTNLKKLRISGTSITGSISADIGNLSQIQELFLQSNNLSGTLPTELGDLTSVKWLYLGQNNFTGTIPESLGNLLAVTNFVIHYNNLSGELPISLGYLPNVSEFRLNSNNLTGCFPWSYTVLCDRPNSGNFQFNNNTGLPGGGNWDDFCSIQTGICAATCDDGFLNGDETDIDCGGSCDICPDCNDGIQNGNETGIDCGGPDCISCNAHPLETWIWDHPEVGESIKWMVDKNSNTIENYFEWNSTLKNNLHSLYDDLLLGNYPTFPDPLNNINNDAINSCITVISDNDASDVYFSFLATSLYHEIQNTFEWSILDFSTQSLNVMYDWAEYFYIANGLITNFQNQFVVGINSTPAPPDYLEANFFSEFNIIDETAKGTYGHVLDFVRDSMLHYTSGCYNHWQYYGDPPMSRIIEGTYKETGGNFGHWSKGCHGTVSFTKWLGFWMNIPVIDDYVGVGHRIAILPSLDSLFITHGDDPYNAGSKQPSIKGRHMLVNKAHFEDTFGDGSYSQELNSNVGRRVNEIALNNLPNSYLSAYCGDYNATGNTGIDNYLANGYAGLANKFVPEMLEAIHFWDRIHLELQSNSNYDWCFSGFTEPIDYEAHGIMWEYLDNAVANVDSSVYKVDLPNDMYGVSSQCISDGDWVEAVIYNADEETWFGLSNANVPLSYQDMDFAIRSINNSFECYKNGTMVASMQDTFGMSVNWLKIDLESNLVKFELNGFVKYQSSGSIGNYNIYIGGTDTESEINNIYSSSTQTIGCCPPNYTNHNNPILNNIYKAENLLNSEGLVPNDGNVLFKAGAEVSLDPGFESEVGSTFEVKTGGCN